MSRVNGNIHSTPITPAFSIAIHFPPVACSQLATCLKECSVCLALTPQLAVLPRCPLGQRWQMFWLWPAGIGSSISTSSAAWKRHFFFPLSLQSSLVFFSPWTSFEQRSWQAGRERSSEIFVTRAVTQRELQRSEMEWGRWVWVNWTATCSRDIPPCCFNVLRRCQWWELTCFEC